ncbi:MAG: hypothetical protein QNL62_18575 [Gammaproteobacteria bacterium]|nr:hypothetical protein [Gammaproteobacteria bacterium]
MKHLIASLLLCFCLITQSTAANRYSNDIRSLPFIEMMVTMMKIMNRMMGIDNNYSALNTLPYSPAFVPGMGMGMGGLSNLPMSPAGLGPLPFNANPTNLWQDSFQAGRNASNTDNNFWAPDDGTNLNSAPVSNRSVNNNSLNGIWQDLSGDVIAIYNNNRFLWSDGNARNLAGQLVIKGNRMIAYIPAKKMTLKFHVYMESGQFIVRDQTSRIYTFKRIH